MSAGAELAIAPLEMPLRLGAIIDGAALAAWLLRRHAGRWGANNPNAMTGIAVLGLLLLVAIGAMRDMRGRSWRCLNRRCCYSLSPFWPMPGFRPWVRCSSPRSNGAVR